MDSTSSPPTPPDAARGPLVVKLGGAAGVDRSALVRELGQAPPAGPLLLVHGGSGEVDALSRRLGEEPRTLVSPSGHVARHTDAAVLRTFTMATALLNRELVAALRDAGVDAFGLSGLDGAAVTARRKAAVRHVEDGRVRVLRDQQSGAPRAVRTELLRALLAQRLTPVLAPVAAGEDGGLLNVDADRLAARVAAALGARALVLLTAAPGLLAEVDDPHSLVRSVDATDLAALDAADAAARGRMRKKTLAAREALDGGVARVVIAASGGDAPLGAALAGGGTHFRPAAAGAQELAL